MMITRPRGPAISSEWRLQADRLVRELHFRDYESALRFVSVIGRIEDFGHHADICVTSGSGGKLQLAVRNLNRAGITEQELRLASKLDAAIGEHYAYAYGVEPSSRAPVEHQADQLIAA